jgi:transcriptional regulator with XRE-family HTH domain
MAARYRLSAALRAHGGLRRIFVTGKRDTPASTPAGKRRVSRKRPESEVDRGGLAGAISDRLAELDREGVSQAEAARRAGCGISTLRNMQNGTGTSHYGHELLTRVATGLGLPEDRLVKAFYPPVPRDPALPSDAEVMVQRLMKQLEPYLATLNAIPGMQTGISGMQKDVAGLQERLEGMACDVQEVKSRLEILVGIDYLSAGGRPGRQDRPSPDLP